MSEVQIAIIDEEDTQITLAVPGVQGPSGAISSGGSANQVFYKVSGTNYDAGWTFIGNANVDAAAAIAGTKISPNFGAQNILTTGTNTAASFIPTSSSIPSNGIYLPAANQVAISTNGTGKLFVDTTGNIGVLAASPSAWGYGGNIAIPGGGRYIASTSDDIRFASNLYESDVKRYSANGFAARYRIADGTHQWSIAATGTAGNEVTLNEAMRIQATGNVAIDTNTLYVDAVNNRVGLGTSGPNDVLDTAAGNYRGISIKCQTTAHRPTLSFLNTTDSLAAYIQATGSSLAFGSMGTDYGGHSPRMTLTATGLGIGTPSPGSKLDVNGEIVCSPNTAGKNTFQLTTAAADDASLLMRSNTTIKVNIQANGISYFNGGNVGINNTDPVTTLDCRGQFAISNGSSSYWLLDRDNSDGRLKLLDTSTSTNERLAVDSSGRLLVGTSSARGVGGPTQALTQVETTAYVAFSAVNNTNDAGGSGLMFGKSRGTAVGSNTIVRSDDDLGNIYFAGADGTDLESVAALITCTVDGTVTTTAGSFVIGRRYKIATVGTTDFTAIGASANTVGVIFTATGVGLGTGTATNEPYANSMPGRLVFSTTPDGSASPSPRMTILSNGKVLVGHTSAVLSSKFLSQFAGNTENGAVLNETANTATSTFLAFALSGTAIGSVARVGATSAVVYNTTSDYRLKTIVGSVTGQGERIDALKPIDFQWKENGEQSRGFLAHEFQTVYANSVTGEKDAVDADGKPVYQAMQASTAEIIADLVAEIQSLRQRLTTAGIA